MDKEQLCEALHKNMLERTDEKLAATAKAAAKAGTGTKNSNYVVKNINGTSKPPYAGTHGKDLLGKYRDVTGSKAEKCAQNGCDRPATVGAHVQQKDGRDKDGAVWYIVPLCGRCNNHNNDEEMVISANIALVRVTDL